MFLLKVCIRVIYSRVSLMCNICISVFCPTIIQNTDTIPEPQQLPGRLLSSRQQQPCKVRISIT